MEIKEILEKLISYQTTKDNKKAFEEAFLFIEDMMPNNIMIEKYTFKDNLSLVLSNTKDKNLDIIFSSHIDVVPHQEYVLKEDENNYYGRGVFDMKGAVSVLLKIMSELKSNLKIGLFITSDEEIDGYCTEQLLKLYTARVAIVPDGGKDFNLIEEEKGLLQLQITSKTKSAHASQPYNGDNAILELYRVYNEIIKLYPLPLNREDYKTSINLSTINGGDALNKVPDLADMFLDIRHTSKNSKEEIIEDIKKISDKIEIKICGSGILFKTNINNELIKNYINVASEELNKEIKIISTESTSDAIYFCEKEIPTIIMNPIGDYAHCPNEFVNKKSLLTLYNIYLNYIEKLEGEN
ncbi:MAG: M20 family metallopeptidase [Bacilli bacterium]